MLILNDVTDAADLRRKLNQITKNIMEKLRDYSFNFGIMHLTQTPFAVKFTVQGTRGKIDVDLLPTFHFDGNVASYNLCLYVFYGVSTFWNDIFSSLSNSHRKFFFELHY